MDPPQMGSNRAFVAQNQTLANLTLVRYNSFEAVKWTHFFSRRETISFSLEVPLGHEPAAEFFAAPGAPKDASVLDHLGHRCRLEDTSEMETSAPCSASRSPQFLQFAGLLVFDRSSGPLIALAIPGNCEAVQASLVEDQPAGRLLCLMQDDTIWAKCYFLPAANLLSLAIEHVFQKVPLQWHPTVGPF